MQSNQLKRFKVGDVQYVSGLFWQVMKNPQTVRVEIKALMEDFSSDGFCSLSDRGQIQTGFGAGQEVKKSYSVAAALKLAVSHESWAGIFKVEEGLYVYVYINDGYILPESDTWSDNLEELISRLDNDISVFGVVQQVYCPGSAMPGSKDIGLGELLTGKPNKHARMQTSVGLPTTKIISTLVLLSLVGGCFYGYTWWQDKKEQDRKAAMQKRLAALALSGYAFPPWNKAEKPSKFASRCMDRLGTEPIFNNGWYINAAVCKGNELEIEYKRINGKIADLARAIPDMKFDLNGETAKVVYTLPEPEQRAAEEAPPVQEAQSRIITLYQSVREQVTINAANPPPPPPAPPGGVAMPPPPPLKFKKFTTVGRITFSPVEFGKALDDLPGTVISELRLNASSFVWEIRGEFYGAI